MTKRMVGGGWRTVAALVVLFAGCSPPAQVSSPAAGPAPTRPTAINDGESLIRAMYERHHDQWYRTLTFVQTTTITRPSTPPTVQIWYESLSLPGKLRIDLGNPELGNGVLYRADSIYNISAGKVTSADTGFNALLVLGFDVYHQPPEQTISVLRHLGYQMSRFRSSTLDGKAAYVVGASSAQDSTSKQFWIERDHLVFMRTREKNAAGNQSEIRFVDYVPAGKTFVARQVWQLLGGQPRLHEEYNSIKADVPLDSALFDPRQWTTAKHWAKP